MVAKLVLPSFQWGGAKLQWGRGRAFTAGQTNYEDYKTLSDLSNFIMVHEASPHLM